MIADLDEALAAMLDFAGRGRSGRTALSAATEALRLLGNPHENLRVIHVTGTSGKTSTSYHVRALLQAAGWRTGLTVSPHIVGLNERVQVDGHPLFGAAFCAHLEQMLSELAPMRGQLTFFELCTCLAWRVFAAERVDYAVVEVGIGGARDATNVARRPDKVSVIGPIGLDHTEKLGSTIGEIAAQKAGIIVPGGVVFLLQQGAEAMDVVQQYAGQLGADVRVVIPPSHPDTIPPSHPDTIPPSHPDASQDLMSIVVDQILPDGRMTGGRGGPEAQPEVERFLLSADWNRPVCPRTGTVPFVRDPAVGDEFTADFRAANWSMAQAVVSYLATRDHFELPDDHAIARARSDVPPARYEWFDVRGHRVLLDGAHNPQKIAGLVSMIRTQGLGPFPTLATLSSAPETKIIATLSALAPVVSRLVVPEFKLGIGEKTKASVPADQVAAAAAGLGMYAEVVPDLDQAVATWLADPAEDLLATGSLYLAALVRPYLV